jgi:endonuclease/exonuclease/phosphatase family metal-dependent hydrolase
MLKLTVASWNIAGGRPVNSFEQFDYSREDIDYFAEQLLAVNPDIVCLQESHTNANRTIAQELADKLGMNFLFNTTNSPSHVDSNFQLGLAILSKHPFDNQSSYQYPYPSFKLLWKDGREADKHHKALQLANVEGIYVANTQMLPINIWGYDYVKEQGLKYAKEIETTLIKKLETPLIFCGDFNFNQPDDIYSTAFRKLEMKDSLPHGQSTRPSDDGEIRSPDHIFFSSDFECEEANIIKTKTDHYLCVSRLIKR